METIVKWKNPAGVWELFPNPEINHASRDHAISLFSGKVPVIASESGTFITNSADLVALYKKQGKPIVEFADLQPSEKNFQYVGFTGVV